ncbi:hypothetical protein PV325_000414 [Microctonus aethiopoides]|uniref:Cytochrome P450 n=1 Tax=Microctonus aethiopoides TaxID=144406 RepID=A0AA39FB13_9HYME|nr:hypothetical protein PV325_000414 [Microctonus aethiopoides]KAK0095606.1 hypothetical protein PV326_007871 [Microctonus aethiopoides]KAK0166259.1 hypothetical protein PV328_004695 [Microctonus aethiopoides]
MDYYISIILAAIIVGLLTILNWVNYKNYFKKHGIPCETPLPIFGNMFQSLFRITPLMDKIRNTYYINTEAKYVGFYDINSPVILIRDPELIKNITSKYFDHFVDHRPFADVVHDPFMANLFLLRGSHWRAVRSILSPAFTPSKMKPMFKFMVDCSQDLTNYMIEQMQTQKTLTIDSKDAFTRFTSDVIAMCAFGLNINSTRSPLNEFFVLGRRGTDFEGLLSLKFFLISSFPKISKLLNMKFMDKEIENYFHKLVSDIITLRDEKGISRPDMIQLMMESRNNINNEIPNLSLQEMTAQAFVFFFGGFDTSSSLMCFLAHEISLNPEVQSKLHDEIDEVHEKYNGEPSFEAINSMQYLDAVISETLRLYPVAGLLDRMCTKSFELPPTLPGTKPFQLQPGNIIMISAYALQTDPKYHPDPDKFIPERFIEDPKKILNSLTYMPFGNGPRMCIGYRFAIMETKVLIYYLLLKCIFKPSKKMILPMKFSTSSFPILPKGGFWLDLQPRNKW